MVFDVTKANVVVVIVLDINEDTFKRDSGAEADPTASFGFALVAGNETNAKQPIDEQYCDVQVLSNN